MIVDHVEIFPRLRPQALHRNTVAPPSACRLMTLRSGQATAAPVASGIPQPIEPPVFIR